jgi:hypothetical protein
MPSRLVAGTYLVKVTTRDAQSEVQVVRPSRSLTTAAFAARWARWYSLTNHGKDSRAAFQTWRTSATFVGGAWVVPRATTSHAQTPGGVGTFQITLNPGRYWFYADNAKIKTVTVVGAARPALPAPNPTVVRFGAFRFGAFGGTSVSLPATIPSSGWMKGIGTPGILSVLWAQRLLPGITAADLRDSCGFDQMPANKTCFARGSFVQLGGSVSAGASALWRYRLPPGRYVVGNGGQLSTFDVPFNLGSVSVVTVA